MASVIFAKIVSKKSNLKYVNKSNDHFDSADSSHSDPTSALIKQIFDLTFTQLNRYGKMIMNSDPIDWRLFVKERNIHRNKGTVMPVPPQTLLLDQLSSDELLVRDQQRQKAREELEKVREEEAKANPRAQRDRIIEEITDRTKEELEKVNQFYDELVVVKLLRLLEVFTNIASGNETVRKYVLRLFDDEIISFLLRLLSVCQSQHCLIVTKILTNLIVIGVKQEVFDHSISLIENDLSSKIILQKKTISRFESSRFLEFCYKTCYAATDSEGQKNINNTGYYNVISSIKQIFNNLLRSQYAPEWKEIIVNEINSFIKNIDDYSIQEFDIMSCFLEGGDYHGLGVGNHAMTSDRQLITIVGFVKQWYGLTPPNGQADSNLKIHEIHYEYKSKDHFVLGITYNKKNPQKSELGIYEPAKLTLINNLDMQTNDYLLDKDRLSAFFAAFKIDETPNKSDSESLTKRCVGMKILVNQIETNGDKLAELMDPAFKNKLIELLLVECTSVTDNSEILKCEYLEQKLYALKKLALEKKISLVRTKNISV